MRAIPARDTRYLSTVFRVLTAKDIAVAIAQIVKARNPYSIVKLKDLQTGEETIVALKAGA
jgi:hypothetical protein